MTVTAQMLNTPKVTKVVLLGIVKKELKRRVKEKGSHSSVVWTVVLESYRTGLLDRGMEMKVSTGFELLSLAISFFLSATP